MRQLHQQLLLPEGAAAQLCGRSRVGRPFFGNAWLREAPASWALNKTLQGRTMPMKTHSQVQTVITRASYATNLADTCLEAGGNQE